MRTISVITAVHPEKVDHLKAAYESLAAQALPNDWEWEWLVQQDGLGSEVASVLPGDPRIKFGSNRHGGPATARTMALARATGELVRVLDGDDQLPGGALYRDIEAITGNADVCWTTSRVLDLLPDGTTAGFEGDPPPGLIERGDVHRYWLAHDFRASVHPATLCVSTRILLMLGGWMALPASEDTGLLLALNAVSFGYFISEPGLLYRKWDGQSTAHAAHVDPDERSARMSIVDRRTRTLMDYGGPVRDGVLTFTDRC